MPLPYPSAQFALSPDPSSWGAPLSLNELEQDDPLHNPDPRRDRKNDIGGSIFTCRGFANLGCLIILAVGLVTLLYVHIMHASLCESCYLFQCRIPHYILFYKEIPFKCGWVQPRWDQCERTGKSLSLLVMLQIPTTTTKIPTIPNNYGLIDVDTPTSAHTITSFADSSEWQLVFSDEFNQEGRTFWPGDDPYWEAVDLHYWQVNNVVFQGITVTHINIRPTILNGITLTRLRLKMEH